MRHGGGGLGADPDGIHHGQGEPADAVRALRGGLQQHLQALQRGEMAQQRKEYAKTVQKKALARASTRDARRLASLQTAGRRMCRELERLMADAQKQLYTHVAIETTDGRSRLTERRLETVDDHRLLNLAKAMREMTGVMRNLYDIQTASEREQLAMAREKLEIEREKLARGDAQDTQVEIVMGEETREYVG